MPLKPIPKVSRTNPPGSNTDSTEVDRLWTVNEAAKYLNLTRDTIYQLVCHKRLPVIKLSARCIRFSKKALLEWVESRTQPVDFN
jgi:excisionase family DNA binding protein